MNDDKELTALYLLNNMRGMLSDKLLQVYEYFGSYEEAYKHNADAYYEAGLFRKPLMRECYEELKLKEDRLLQRKIELEDQGIQLISMFDDGYPNRLQNIDDRPPLLYLYGHMPSEEKHTVGIIGSRKCSEYGRSVAMFMADELAKQGVQIVSGLAYGIDGAAAEGALQNAGESYAVLGTGINICYPKENWTLYNRMRNGEGGIMSEFPPDAPAAGFHFIQRNRIIAGLSDALLVIEAAERSGTSTTVGYALDQGKEVFALPGRITDPLGFGCNRMLREGASILTSPSDVLEYFGMEQETTLQMRSRDISKLNALEKKLYQALEAESQHLERIAEKTGLSIRDTMTGLASLELKGYCTSPRSAYYRKL